ncbi:MAG: TIR domain-containing protein [Bacteroidetes bacterium]|nr:TIR domain-containing protein [Bacteroidota bacterium]
MTTKVFISYYFGDASFKGEVVKWLNEAGIAHISTDKNDLRPDGAPAVKKAIGDQLASCTHLLVLVGNDTHNRPRVNYEVSVSNNKSRGWVRLPNRTGAAPEEVRNMFPIEFSKHAILSWLRQ